jgi:hypothetical protein
MSICWRKWLGLSASVLAVGLVAAFVPGSAGATSNPSYASNSSLEKIQNSWSYVSEYATAPALASGRLTAARGNAMAGATVIVFPVPKSPEAGESLTPVARATTNADGRYTLHLPAAKRALLLGARSEAYMNMQIIAFYPDAIAIRFVPLERGAAEAVSANLVLRQLPSADEATQPASARPAFPLPPGAEDCYLESNYELPNIPMVVGYKSTHTASEINYAQVTYSSSVNQSSGAAYSLTGSSTTFSASGTTETTSDIDLPFPKITGASNNYMAALTLWNDDYLECYGPGTAWYAWEVYLNSVTTPDGTPGAPSVAAGKCSTASPGIPITYSTTTQATWAEGVNFTDYIGINLSSQDGWTTSTSLTYDLKKSAPICGVTNYPNGNNPSAGYLQVH